MAPLTAEQALEWFTDLEQEADTNLAQAIDRIEHAQMTEDQKNRTAIMNDAKAHLAAALKALAQAQFVRTTFKHDPD